MDNAGEALTTLAETVADAAAKGTELSEASAEELGGTTPLTPDALAAAEGLSSSTPALTDGGCVPTTV